MAKLREFQEAAVERIVERLTDPEGSRRFLLADEVGLGKTIVAKGVITRLHERRPARGFSTVYICSNNEIAEQNRDKLCDGRNSSIPGRLTLMALQSLDIDRRREAGQKQVFAFSPGTSLQLERGTGIMKERRLLLYLLFSIWGKPAWKKGWASFFCCSAKQDRWKTATKRSALKREFSRTVSRDLRRRLKRQWDNQRVRLPDGTTRQMDELPIKEALIRLTSFWNYDRKGREVSLVIGELRKGLAKVCLEFLKPDLIILDEFQRFSDILLECRNAHSIAGKLFQSGSGSILILSATPYKMFTLAHEPEKHHEEFLKTFAFLLNTNPDVKDNPRLDPLRKELKGFRVQLDKENWADQEHDEVLAESRTRIESILRAVMCRTERNWYLEDAAKGMREVEAEGVRPEKAELTDYIHLRRFLAANGIGDWNITDFWKSSPFPLAFMDRHYALVKWLPKNPHALLKTVIPPASGLSAWGNRNAKVRMLLKKVFGGDTEKAMGWKYLWVKPTYLYYEDRFYKDEDPQKFLLFSHWRFVPKAISILISAEAGKRIGGWKRLSKTAPLQFRLRQSFSSFDICYPSPALATIVHPLDIRIRYGKALNKQTLFREARRLVQDALRKADVAIRPGRSSPLWQVVARLENSLAGNLQPGYDRLLRLRLEETNLYLPDHIRQYKEWMKDDGSSLTLSPEWVKRLTDIALYSPAVSVLRAFLSINPEGARGDWPIVLEFCLLRLRHYFNRRMVQAILRRHGKGASYIEKVLDYCRQAHFQAVVDEYAYLVGRDFNADDGGKFLKHLGRAMGMWAGSPAINELKNGRLSLKPQQTHFALAFGDEVSTESTDQEGAGRKTAVREAFNSPFWPFVLTTTSVGQEGLDFHLYCRDIVHWNLPSNPVDLEQREGRINRYDGLAIRRNICRDYPLQDILPMEGRNLWLHLFQLLMARNPGRGRFKHGLFPHWIYLSGKGACSDSPILTRHLLFYSASADRRHYAALKNALSLYRLVFGQPRQQDILDRIMAGHQAQNTQDLTRRLAKYMINLSPFSDGHARRRAERDASSILADPDARVRLQAEVTDYMAGLPAALSEELSPVVRDLLDVPVGHPPHPEEHRLRAIVAILYLLDPFDDIPDRYGSFGYSDDIKFIRETHALIFGAQRLQPAPSSLSQPLLPADPPHPTCSMPGRAVP
jgi:hypothetical protein